MYTPVAGYGIIDDVAAKISAHDDTGHKAYARCQLEHAPGAQFPRCDTASQDRTVQARPLPSWRVRAA